MQLHLILIQDRIIDTAACLMQPELSLSIQLLCNGIPCTIKTVESRFVYILKKKNNKTPQKYTEQEIYFRFEFLNLGERQAVLNIVQLQVNKATDKSFTDSFFLMISASPTQIGEVSSEKRAQELSDEKKYYRQTWHNYYVTSHTVNLPQRRKHCNIHLQDLLTDLYDKCHFDLVWYPVLF